MQAAAVGGGMAAATSPGARRFMMSRPTGGLGRAVGAIGTGVPAAGAAALPFTGGQLKEWPGAVARVPQAIRDFNDTAATARNLAGQVSKDYADISQQVRNDYQTKVQPALNTVKSVNDRVQNIGSFDPMGWLSQMNPSQQAMLGGGALMGLLPLLGGLSGQQQPSLWNTMGPMASMAALAYFYPQLAQYMNLPVDPVSSVMNYASGGGTATPSAAPPASPPAAATTTANP
jgi:hypothetical protein